MASISVPNIVHQWNVVPGLKNLKARSKLSSPMSERTLSLCDFICLYAPNTTTRNLWRGWPHLDECWSFAYLVNDVPTRSVCQLAASFSLQSPLMEAEMETAADNAPVNAK